MSNCKSLGKKLDVYAKFGAKAAFHYPKGICIGDNGNDATVCSYQIVSILGKVQKLLQFVHDAGSWTGWYSKPNVFSF